MARNIENNDNDVLEHKHQPNRNKRYQERLIVGKSGLLARIYQSPSVSLVDHDDDFGRRVCIKDASRSGLGLTTTHKLELDTTCMIQIVGMPPLKGSLIYQESSKNGEFRCGFCLDEWLSEEIHQDLSLFR
ncbi:hypothetical protein [Enterovibrio nigricans]|uniref:PilZ domain-containing protein n=1 Tax=Enterovibrio nigricans DSM 22720 TaxID=1121868 RepID=A0A1T4VHR2_9GAMM|nr:hypothetical protein [Enterovibrio nigricans]PKF49651.1 PilZ domain-containing protein [Enterovibrio nigricans]SKA64428.1 hypothetical protein SAMN02745132_03854 [Enterovibrio nigricans DSM 22720]